MSDSLKERITMSIDITIVIFFITSVIWKVIHNIDYWFEMSALYSLSWGIGYFIRKEINQKEEYNILGSELTKTHVKIILIIIYTIIFLFFAGVIFNIDNLGYIFTNSFLGFSVSIFLKYN